MPPSNNATLMALLLRHETLASDLECMLSSLANSPSSVMSNNAVPQPSNDEVLQYGGRDFCAFGFRHKISCVPVDEVHACLHLARVPGFH